MIKKSHMVEPQTPKYACQMDYYCDKNSIDPVGGGNIPGMRLSKERRYRQLAEYADKYFGVVSVDYKWYDMDYLPYDLFPLVGKVYPWSKHMYQATGYMKWGLSNGTAAATILHDIVTGWPHPSAHYFNSMRMRPILNIPAAIVRHFTKR